MLLDDDDDDVFLAHIDLSLLNLSMDDPSAEVLMIIEDVFIIGGVDNREHEKMRSDHPTNQIVPKTVSLKRLAKLVKKIKYHNRCVNMIEGSTTVDDIHVGGSTCRRGWEDERRCSNVRFLNNTCVGRHAQRRRHIRISTSNIFMHRERHGDWPEGRQKSEICSSKSRIKCSTT